MICVSVAERDLKEALSALKEAERLADLTEIRLDALDRPEVKPFLEAAQKPLLFTFRAKEEGGLKEVPLEERLAHLKEAAAAGAFAVDLELSAGEENILALKKALFQTKLVLSFHDFLGTPSLERLEETVREMQALGAHVGKVITTAHRPEEALLPLRLIVWAQKELSFPLISFAMGKVGAFSRVVALLLGAPWSYAALPQRSQTAPGQLTAPVLKEILTHLK